MGQAAASPPRKPTRASEAYVHPCIYTSMHALRNLPATRTSGTHSLNEPQATLCSTTHHAGVCVQHAVPHIQQQPCVAGLGHVAHQEAQQWQQRGRVAPAQRLRSWPCAQAEDQGPAAGLRPTRLGQHLLLCSVRRSSQRHGRPPPSTPQHSICRPPTCGSAPRAAHSSSTDTTTAGCRVPSAAVSASAWRNARSSLS